LQEYNGQYFLTALGAREEELIINVELPPRWRNMSSIHPRTDFTSSSDPVEKRKIPVTTLDALLDKHDFQAPFGLKIDTEGFEYQVIEGATNFLRDTQFVIAEVNVAKVYEGSYSFAEFIEIMAENDFALCDILYTKKEGPGEVLFVDAVFRRADSPSRR
jgi:FkbM family methyltransferase